MKFVFNREHIGLINMKIFVGPLYVTLYSNEKAILLHVDAHTNGNIQT